MESKTKKQKYVGSGKDCEEKCVDRRWTAIDINKPADP